MADEEKFRATIVANLIGMPYGGPLFNDGKNKMGNDSRYKGANAHIKKDIRSRLYSGGKHSSGHMPKKERNVRGKH